MTDSNPVSKMLVSKVSVSKASSDKNTGLSKTLKPPVSWWQKRAVTISVAMLGLLCILIVMSINVVKYETHLATGKPVLLQLAPVDPRGFMQGDYMALSYALERDVLDALSPKPHTSDSEFNNSEPNPDIYEPSEGYVIVALDEHNVGQFVRLADSSNRDGLAANEIPIHYRIRNGSVQLATNAFFFQEGHAEAFEAAKYGLFRVNNKGDPLLTDMVNGEFEVIVGKSSLDDKTSN
ncbi:GDYXXLXY domain-containing protein [Psychrobacter sp. CAL346-MNA-CIBAN-0220]|uniref:GDYXXLXY domain-containing protein n=1 Tax=Psychrobacter sp. CAL346-MNA-CIBAN-0220 TaxID=3140457 RepID=UPI00331FC7A9